MRDVSVPSWAALREPSAGSISFSEDEVQGDIPPRAATKPSAKGPSVRDRPVDAVVMVRQAGRGYNANKRGQNDERISVAGSSVRNSNSTPQTRRPPSSEDEEQRPKRKKKKKILNADVDGALFTRVSLPVETPRGTQAARHSLSANVPTPLRIPRRPNTNRRVTLDIGALREARDQLADTAGSVASKNAPQSPAHLKRRTGATLRPASISRKRSMNASTGGHPPPEVISLVSEDEMDQPPVPSTPATSKAAEKVRETIPLPRRTTSNKSAIPQTTYREEDGVIILDGSDDEVVPPPSRERRSARPSSVPASQAPIQTSSPRASPSTLRDSPEPITEPPGTAFSSKLRSPEPVSPTRHSISRDCRDIEMIDANPAATDVGVVDVEMASASSRPDSPSGDKAEIEPQVLEDPEPPNLEEHETYIVPSETPSGYRDASGSPPLEQVSVEVEVDSMHDQDDALSRVVQSPIMSPPLSSSKQLESSTSSNHLQKTSEERSLDEHRRASTATDESFTIHPQSTNNFPRAHVSSSPDTPTIRPGEPAHSPKSPTISRPRPRWRKDTLYGNASGFFRGALRQSQQRRSHSRSPSLPLNSSRMSSTTAATHLTSVASPTAAYTSPVGSPDPALVAATAAGSPPVSPPVASPPRTESPESSRMATPERHADEPSAPLPGSIMEGVRSQEESSSSDKGGEVTDVQMTESSEPPAPPRETTGPPVLADSVQPTTAQVSRNNTPPVASPSTRLTGPTLSEVIKNAMAQNARKSAMMNKAPTSRQGAATTREYSGSVSRPPSAGVSPDPSGPRSPTSIAPGSSVTLSRTPTNSPPMVDLSAFQSTRRNQRSPIKVINTVTSTPLIPGHGRRSTFPVVVQPSQSPSATHILDRPTLHASTQSPSPTLASIESTTASSAPASPVVGQATPVAPKPMLPRRTTMGHPLQQIASPTLTTPQIPRHTTHSVIPVIPRRNSAVAGHSRDTSIDTVSVAVTGANVAGTSTEPIEIGSSPPPQSATEQSSDSEEECCNLVYPSSTSENDEIADAEVEEEDSQPVRLPFGRRTRALMDSGDSSGVGPRRSARISSSSASSSAEPPEVPVNQSRRLRPRGSIIRSDSEEGVVSYGGISRKSRSKFTHAFENSGFAALSWHSDQQRIAKEFSQDTRLAKDIPHDLFDRLNALSPWARRAGNVQVLIFEAEIRANTADDEPNAPPIRIVNEVDDELTPPLEFYYSNLMWHGRGVPKPDLDAVRGCGCVGPCDPNSKTCLCFQKNLKYHDFYQRVAPSPPGIPYDKRGRLKPNAEKFPIFECNNSCGCSDDCPNRVIQRGRQHELTIQKTPNKGWGIFAGSKKIPAYSFIGIYAGEYLKDAEAEERGTIYNEFGRTYLFDVDFWHLKDEEPVNHHQILYTVDAYHAGNFTRYLNHSCDPNCHIVAAYINEANLDKPLFALFTIKDVEPYAEICFSYFGPMKGEGDDDDDIDEEKPRKNVFSGGVYIQCQCGAANCRGNMWT